MTTITTRAAAGAPLSNATVDANFTNLNTAKLELGQAQSSGTANAVLYLNASKQVASGSGLTFDGTKLGVGTASPLVGGLVTVGDGSTNASQYLNGGSTGGAIIGRISGSNTWIVGDTASALGSGTGLINYVYGNNPTIWYNNSSEQMRLTGTGLGIGTSSPSAKLDVAGGIRALRNGADSFGSSALYIGNAANNEAFAWQQSASGATLNLWAYSASTGISAWTNQLSLTASGNVGIGTSSPFADTNYKSIDIRGTTGGEVNLGTAAGVHGQIVSNATSGMLLNTVGSTPMLFYTVGTERMRLDASGNLGLGVTPSAWLSGYKAFENFSGALVGETAASLGMYQNCYRDGSGNFIYKNTGAASRTQMNTGAFYWLQAPSGTAGTAITFTQAMTLDASGNLFIGKTSSSLGTAGIEAQAVGYLAVARPERPLVLNRLTTDGDLIELYRDSVSKATFGVTSNALTFGVAGTERARIDSSGNLLVGTTSTPLTIATGSAASGFAYASGAWLAIATSSDKSLILNRLTTDGSIAEFRRSGTAVGSISVTTTATAYNTSSDYRLKNITGPITTSGQYIDSLKPVEGTWKADGSTFVGLIAHEVQEVSRTQVATGVKDGEQMQGMDYSAAEIIANLIAELQSLRKRVAQLEAK